MARTDLMTKIAIAQMKVTLIDIHSKEKIREAMAMAEGINTMSLIMTLETTTTTAMIIEPDCLQNLLFILL